MNKISDHKAIKKEKRAEECARVAAAKVVRPKTAAVKTVVVK